MNKTAQIDCMEKQVEGRTVTDTASCLSVDRKTVWKCLQKEDFSKPARDEGSVVETGAVFRTLTRDWRKTGNHSASLPDYNSECYYRIQYIVEYSTYSWRRGSK